MRSAIIKNINKCFFQHYVRIGFILKIAAMSNKNYQKVNISVKFYLQSGRQFIKKS